MARDDFKNLGFHPEAEKKDGNEKAAPGELRW